jgi:hypothetical protein
MLLFDDLDQQTMKPMPIRKIIDKAQQIAYSSAWTASNYKDYYDNLSSQKDNKKKLK